MPVVIKGLPKPPYRPAARSISNAVLAALVPTMIKHQAAGALISRDLAESLNAGGIVNPSGRPWSHPTVFRLLQRAKRLGFEVVLRSRSDATSARRVHRRCRDEILLARAAEREALREKARLRRAAADPGIAAPGVSL